MSKKRSNNYWTEDLLHKEALKYKTKGEFSKSSNSAYVTACKFKIIDKICSHMIVVWQKKWDINTLTIEALKYNTKKEFIANNSKAYHSAKYHGILDKICSHMIPCRNLNWNEKSLQKEALKYKTRSEFMKNSGGAYQAAHNLCILNNICKHMISRMTKWTNDELKLEALKYKTMADFKNNSKSAYFVSYTRGIKDNICKHMMKSQNVSAGEKEILNIVKLKYPNAKTFRDNNVKIKDKSYIKRLHIDIFIPELNKGIEFDGRWHHSLEGLKRGHPTWSLEDITNYHEIKDSWFKSKGIKILHVNENDWRKDKQKCIDECLKFLGVK